MADQITREACVPYNPALTPAYGYDPSLSAGIVFSIFFGLSLIGHVVQMSIKRKWWYFPFALGAVGEFMGWVARAVAHKCAYSSLLFTLQIAILIIAPCFFSAGIYYILGQLINRWGRKYSLVSPRMYLIIFVGLDLVSIVIQGTGGGMASAENDNNESTTLGTDIMLAGIILQLVSMSVFFLLWCFTLWRAQALLKPVRALIIGTTFSAILILIRNFYRCVELSQGWTGYLITHQVYFCVFDATLMTLAVGTFNFTHPAWYFDGAHGLPENTEPSAAQDSDAEKNGEVDAEKFV